MCQFSPKQVLKGGTNEISYSLVCLLFCRLRLWCQVQATSTQVWSVSAGELPVFKFTEKVY